ncbi:MAG: M3 family oligoendopeptidase [Chloroflexi bacterium]|nr:M3 family oligoendopeptidase [Chloroflexota bacterium]
MTSETEKLPHWDLTNVFPSLGSKEFDAAFEEYKEKLEDLDEYLAKHNISSADEGTIEQDPPKLAEILAGLLDRFNYVLHLSGTINAYLFSFISTDSYNNDAKRAMSLQEQQNVRLEKHDVSISAWIGSIAQHLLEINSQNDITKSHAFYLEETAEQSKFLMTGPEENLAAELSMSGANAWAKLQGTVTSQLKVEFEVDGKTETTPITGLLNYAYHVDEAVRRRAYETENAAWQSVSEPLAASLNGVKGAVGTLNRKRGRRDDLHSSLDQARIDQQTIESMLGAMKDSFPMFRKYFNAKAKRLGKETMAWWDLFAPVGESDSTMSYPGACKFILEQFKQFSPELAEYSQNAIANNHLDMEPRDGKRPGGFCMYVPKVEESRIFINYDGSLDNVFTIAHELGHAYHNHVRIGKTMLNRQTPMTLAETASIMCETIVTDAAIAHADSTDDELAILDTNLIGSSQVVVDIYSRYLFESEVFERRAEAELSVDDFNDIMLRAQKAAYGDALDEKYLQQYMWTWKPHYYSPGRSFYNYPYAFGLLFATGLYAIYQERGADFIPDFVDLLASTGEANAADLAARFDIDLRTPTFWENSLKVVGQRIDRYIEI